MALTVSVLDDNVVGARRRKVLSVTFDDSYPTGGESLTPADAGLVSFTHVSAEPADGYVFEFDHTNEKVIAYWVDTTTDGAPMAQVANTTDLATVVSRVVVEGF